MAVGTGSGAIIKLDDSAGTLQTLTELSGTVTIGGLDEEFLTEEFTPIGSSEVGMLHTGCRNLGPFTLEMLMDDTASTGALAILEQTTIPQPGDSSRTLEVTFLTGQVWSIEVRLGKKSYAVPSKGLNRITVELQYAGGTVATPFTPTGVV